MTVFQPHDGNKQGWWWGGGALTIKHTHTHTDAGAQATNTHRKKKEKRRRHKQPINSGDPWQPEICCLSSHAAESERGAGT